MKRTDATTLAQIVPAGESDLAVGKCVQVRQAGAGTGTAATTSADPTQPVMAGTVVISDPVNGTCMRSPGGGAGRGGGGSSAGGSSAGGSSAGGGGGGGVVSGRPRGAVRGTVASLTGDTMTVTPAARAGASASPGADAPRTVTLSSSTVYSRFAPASSADLSVGKCVSAFGSPAGTAITADTIIVRPDNGSCAGAGAAAGASSTPTTGADKSATATSVPSDNGSDTTTPTPADSSAGSSGN